MNVTYYSVGLSASAEKRDSSGVEVNIKDIFKAIESGTWCEHAEAVRNAKDDDEKKKIKSSMPYFTGSGTFKTRSEKGLIQHSGILVIDIDKLEDVNDVKSYISQDQFSWFTCESISGKGLCIFVKIDPSKHIESFHFLEDYYFRNYGIKIDQSCKDVSRPRLITFDPNAVLNENAIRLSLEKERSFDPEKIIGIAENMIRSSIDGERHNKLLKASRLMGGYVGSGLLDENEVLTRLKSVWCEKNFDPSYKFEDTIKDGIEYGRAYPITIEQFKEQIQKSAEDKKRLNKVYAYARQINCSGRTYDGHDIISMCELHLLNKEKVTQIFKKVFDEETQYFDFDNKPKHVKTEIIVGDKWEFRRNVVTQSTDYRIRENKSSVFEKVNYDTVTRFALHCGQTTSPDKIKSLLRSDFVPEYDPIKTYFLNLNQWDGQTDHISNYADHIKTESQEFFLTMFKKHLVRAVAQIMENEVNRFVFVLVGEKQSTGKSTFIRSLSPFHGGQYYTESKVRDDKDGQFAFAENFIYNIEELSDMGNNDVNRLKAMISQAIIKERKPYSVDAEPIARRCTFFGSTNNDEFLTDTENTRWLCFKIQSIDWSYSKLNIDDLWSQAFALWQNKDFNRQLSMDEFNIQSVSNKNHEVTATEKELIKKYFQVSNESGNFYSLIDILEVLTIQTDSMYKLNPKLIGKFMIQLGFLNAKKYINGKQVRGYFAEQIKGNYEENENYSGLPF
jgi:hypothetical protein